MLTFEVNQNLLILFFEPMVAVPDYDCGPNCGAIKRLLKTKLLIIDSAARVVKMLAADGTY